jgi:DNA polymerase V
VVLDNYGKYTGFAECRYEDVQRLLHPLPVGEMWGVGRQMQKHFQHMGIYTIGDLANFDLAVLKEKFGVNGERLYLNANGIDSSPVLYSADAPPQSVFGFDNGRGNSVIKSVGRGATLLRDYINLEDIKLVIRELSEEVCEVMRSESIAGKTIHLSVDYSKKEKVSGFSRQKTIKYHTNDVVEIINTCYELLEKFHKKGAPARLIRVSVGRFIDEHYVLMTFDKDKTKRRILADISDKINSKFGKGTLRRASSYIDASVAKDRMKKIAGHFE